MSSASSDSRAPATPCQVSASSRPAPVVQVPNWQTPDHTVDKRLKVGQVAVTDWVWKNTCEDKDKFWKLYQQEKKEKEALQKQLDEKGKLNAKLKHDVKDLKDRLRDEENYADK